MITLTSPAFEFLRKHKQVSEETESLVMKRLKGKITQDELFTVFERGITGEFGKVYSLDPQTLIGWVQAHQKQKTTSRDYMNSGLVSISEPHFDFNNDDWMKEANKCLTAFLNGVSEQYFHPSVYDRMMLDGKIELNASMKYVQQKEGEFKGVVEAKQKVLRDIFLTYKSKGWNQVYFIR